VAASALVLGFAGCKQDEAGDSDMITVSGTTASINYTNSGTDTNVRGFKTIRNTKKAGGTCQMGFDPNVSNLSVQGFVFDEKETTDSDNATVYAFYLLGVRYNNGTIQYYLSHFTNVKGSELTGNATTFGTETTIWKGSTSAYCDATSSKLVTDGEYKGYVGVEVDVTQTDGVFTVTLYNSDETQLATESFNANKYDDNLTEDATKNVQGYVGFYANVKNSYTLNGHWELSNLKESSVGEVAE